MTDANPEAPIFEMLLDFLRQSRGFDFAGYKRSSLQRRVSKAMQSHQIETYGEYLDYLQVHPEEFLPLFNTILINVTAFFRDTDAWSYLREQALPRLLSDKPQNAPIRIWSAGCASGEEAYTLAIILAEALGPESYRQRVKIYATDVDEEALNQARQATYSDKALTPVDIALRDRYFASVGERYSFRPDLRRMVIFGRHDLVQDAPISRLDLLVCRNTLMYFNAETQAKILDRFHFALQNTGILFLGKAEMLLTHANLFTPINLQHRIFRRVPKRGGSAPLLVPSMSEDQKNNQIELQRQLREGGFDASSAAQLIVDVTGHLVLANAQARALFGIQLLAMGRPFQDLEISYRPLELRSHIEHVYSERRPVIVRDVIYKQRETDTQYLDIQITPLEDPTSELLGASITFNNVTRYHDLQEELQRSTQELETINEELQSSNEELETTNEELQSTNDELETTNEELQSTNEELETMNEELQSTNEELQTINDELNVRTGELNQANAFLNSILTSFRAAVIVIDLQFMVLTWNDQAENLWGLRTEEVQGQSIFSLDIGLPVDQLREPIRSCLAGEQEDMILSTINRRGQRMKCHISFGPLVSLEGERLGVILIMEEAEDDESQPE